jgi:plasmid stability protein
VASLTIRNLDESIKGRLRIRAAARGRSMEEEARHILSSALSEAPTPGPDLAESIRRRFAAFGDVQLPVPQREPVREPPAMAEEAPAPRGAGRAVARSAPRPRRRG